MGRRGPRGALLAAAVAAVLAAAFWFGGDAPDRPETPAPTVLSPAPAGDTVPATPTELMTPTDPSDSADPAILVDPADPATSTDLAASSNSADPATPATPAPARSESPTESTEPAEPIRPTPVPAPPPAGAPVPARVPDDSDGSDGRWTCTLSISCATALDHLDRLAPEKAELLPADGWILPAVQVPFDRGESVFQVLLRTCQEQGVHLEFNSNPLYDSAYIEGIQNLYELDCGELSGWMYAVNGQFLNYGCSRCLLQDGDVVQWAYTCDLGGDLGGTGPLGG